MPDAAGRCVRTLVMHSAARDPRGLARLRGRRRVLLDRGQDPRLRALLNSYVRPVRNDPAGRPSSRSSREGRGRGLRSHRADDQPLLRERSPRPQLRRAAAPAVRVVHARSHRRRPVRRARRLSTGSGCACAIHDAVRFLDDVIDANRYPLPEIERATKATRKIGLGIMGWADALAALDIAYDSDARSRSPTGREFLESESLAASRALAERRGAVPRLAGIALAAGRAPARCATRPRPRSRRPARSASSPAARAASSRSTRSPTGATSSTAPSSPRSIPRSSGSPPSAASAVAELFAASPSTAACAATRRPGRRPAPVPDRARVDVDMHVRMQAAFQRHVHAAVSKTINLRRDATAPTSKLRTSSRTSWVARESPSTGTAAARARCSSPARGPLRTGRARAARSAARCSSSRAHCRLCRHCGWSVCG